MAGKIVEIKKLFALGAEKLNLEIDENGLKALTKYYDELCRWSKKINLVGKKQSVEQLVENHFLDSLLLLHSLDSACCRLADVGSGAGFPGLVCKAVRPELEVVLIEPRLKRVSFLRHVVRILKLTSVDVIPERVEEVDEDIPPFTHVTSRAVAEISDFLKMVELLPGQNCRILCMKGPKWKEELARASGFMKEAGIALERTDEYTLPYSGAERAILTFRSGKIQ